MRLFLLFPELHRFGRCQWFILWLLERAFLSLGITSALQWSNLYFSDSLGVWVWLLFWYFCLEYCCGVLKTLFNCCCLGIFMFEESGIFYRIVSFRTELLVGECFSHTTANSSRFHFLIFRNLSAILLLLCFLLVRCCPSPTLLLFFPPLYLWCK